jgi:hypothetical protein
MASAKGMVLLLLVGTILSFVSVALPVGMVLALALITCVMDRNVADNNIREITSGLLFLILYSIGYCMK